MEQSDGGRSRRMLLRRSRVAGRNACFGERWAAARTSLFSGTVPTRRAADRREPRQCLSRPTRRSKRGERPTLDRFDSVPPDRERLHRTRRRECNSWVPYLSQDDSRCRGGDPYRSARSSRLELGPGILQIEPSSRRPAVAPRRVRSRATRAPGLVERHYPLSVWHTEPPRCFKPTATPYTVRETTTRRARRASEITLENAVRRGHAPRTSGGDHCSVSRWLLRNSAGFGGRGGGAGVGGADGVRLQDGCGRPIRR